MRYIADDGWNVIEDEVFVGVPKSPGMDNHAYVVEKDYTRHIRCRFDANGASEAAKASKKYFLSFVDCALVRGVEDAGDFVDCHYVSFLRCHFSGRGRKITNKGGGTGFSYTDCTGLDLIEDGNYTIYDGKAMRPWTRFWPASPKTAGTLVSSSGSPWVTAFWAQRAEGECRTFRWWPAAIAIFFYVRRNFFKEKGANAANSAQP